MKRETLGEILLFFKASVTVIIAFPVGCLVGFGLISMGVGVIQQQWNQPFNPPVEHVAQYAGIVGLVFTAEVLRQLFFEDASRK